MATIYELSMQEVEARLVALPAWAPSTDNIRRRNRTEVTRDNTPRVHIIDGVDEKASGTGKACYWLRIGYFTVALFVRDDAGEDIIDGMKAEVMTRLSDEGTAYATGARLEPGRILPEEAIADQGAIRIDMEFAFHYQVKRWTLDQAAS